MPHPTFPQVWQQIQSKTLKNPVPFKYKSVAYYWLHLTTGKWLHDKDPSNLPACGSLSTATSMELRFWILKLSLGPRYLHSTFEVLFLSGPLTPTSFLLIPLVSPCLVDSVIAYWSNIIVNTNKSNMELFAGLADMTGAGLPLSYLFYHHDSSAAPFTKQTTLKWWYQSLQLLGINPQSTLSDKDITKCNVLRAIWPDAKHQYCLWHCLWALKQCLANSKYQPTHYNTAHARECFSSFISKDFVPSSQLNISQVCSDCPLLLQTLIVPHCSPNPHPHPMNPFGVFAFASMEDHVHSFPVLWQSVVAHHHQQNPQFWTRMMPGVTIISRTQSYSIVLHSRIVGLLLPNPIFWCSWDIFDDI